MTSIENPANNLYRLLKKLLSEPGIDDWVAATVLTKHRSSYRKPGAMMLVNPVGQTFGLISGGCLESDIVLRARRVLEYGSPEYVIYDSMEDGNIAAELGLGCNGRIGVLVEAITGANCRLYRRLLDRMESGLSSALVHAIDPRGSDSGVKAVLDNNLSPVEAIDAHTKLPSFDAEQKNRPELVETAGYSWSVTDIKPPVRLLIVGGGVDARPVAELAVKLGWRVTVADHRTINARRQHFPGVEALVDRLPEDLTWEIDADAAVVMSHNLDMDADWLQYCRALPNLRYLGLLGPESRKLEVLSIAGMDSQDSFSRQIHGPMGIDIGGDLPESVAVSVIAQCHQVLAKAGML